MGASGFLGAHNPVIVEKHVAPASAHFFRRSWVGGCHGNEWFLGAPWPATRVIQW